MKIAQLLEANKKQRNQKRNAIRKQQKANKKAGVTQPPVEQPNTAGAGAFGNIANTLTPDPKAPAASSTGGVTTPTDTGLTHAASPTNLNQPKPEVPAETPAAAPEETPAVTAKSPSGYNPKTGVAFNNSEERAAYFAQAGQVDPRKAAAAPEETPATEPEAPAATPEVPATNAGAAGQKAGGVVQNIKNAWNDAKQGYQAGQSQAAPAGRSASGGGPSAGALAQINTRLDRVEQALGIAEGKVFHSKFLGMDI
jgi:hypothetical protein